jgi:hypothetical protein
MLNSIAVGSLQGLSHASIYPLLAAVTDPTPDLAPVPTPNIFGAQLRDVLIIVGAATVLGLILFLYIYLTRRDRRTHSQTGARALYRAEKRNNGEPEPGKRRLRKRRKQVEEFSHRNPTLGETGGLPPLRADEPVEPAS